jgi:hypothetical protein
MTFAELTAAIWDGRSVTLTDHAGRSIEAVPLSVDRRDSDDHGTYWRVHYRTDRDTVASLLVRFDSFDGH